jgi:hypothetical protein
VNAEPDLERARLGGGERAQDEDESKHGRERYQAFARHHMTSGDTIER